MSILRTMIRKKKSYVILIMESHGSSPSHAELPHLFVRDAAVARFLNALLHVVHDATHDGEDGKNDDE